MDADCLPAEATSRELATITQEVVLDQYGKVVELLSINGFKIQQANDEVAMLRDEGGNVQQKLTSIESRLMKFGVLTFLLAQDNPRNEFLITEMLSEVDPERAKVFTESLRNLKQEREKLSKSADS